MRLKLRQFVLVHETGLVIQLSLFWLAASPNGLDAYQTSEKKLLLEIKCPHTKRQMWPIDLVQDPNFYMKKNLEKITFYWLLLTNSASNGTFWF